MPGVAPPIARHVRPGFLKVKEQSSKPVEVPVFRIEGLEVQPVEQRSRLATAVVEQIVQCQPNDMKGGIAIVPSSSARRLTLLASPLRRAHAARRPG